MNIELQPGTYVVAVSGGVDSMALLHMLTTTPGVRLVVAHYDHGIRSDSETDRRLVQESAHAYGLPFVFDEGKIGGGASEAVAREARYAFLDRVRKASGARAIVTAHHHDDVLETAVINLLRGTGRKGMSALGSHDQLVRPLLDYSKAELRQYARDQGLIWREDVTNQDTRYLRNHVRHKLLSRLSPGERLRLAEQVRRARELNEVIEHELTNYLHLQPARDRLDRQTFVCLPHAVAREVLAAWLRSHEVRSFDKRLLERLVVSAKTLPPGRAVDVLQGVSLHIGRHDLALRRSDR